MTARQFWDSESTMARLGRSLLTPASLLYVTATRLRNMMYDRGVLSVHDAAVPVISIGNLAVGGTGKTPVASWVASELQRRGARPAIVMRGYGDDESRVHALLNPTVPVVVNADRVAGVRDAAESGASVVVLDDAFQHRRVARVDDVVLVNADRWREPVRLLPAGPWRELPRALSRASLVLVTRKAANPDAAMSLLRKLIPLTGSRTGAIAFLEPIELRQVLTGETRSLSGMRGSRVLVAAGIGDPTSLESQLVRAGLEVSMRVFPDHHAYSASDAIRLARDASAFAHVLCTLKDAVKLGPLWPRQGPPLWYVSLRCRIESGEADVSAMLDRLAASGSQHISGAPSGPATTPYT